MEMVKKMVVTLSELKGYLRIDTTDDDLLLEGLIETSEKLCADILRLLDISELESVGGVKTAVLYACSYLYEHREEADHRKLTLDLRALLFGDRSEEF